MADAAIAWCAAWLLTYLIHSTLLLGGVYLVARWMNARFEPFAESAWRAALFGGVLTSVAQTVLVARHSALLLVSSAGSIAPPSRMAVTVSRADGVAAMQPALVKVLVVTWAA